MRRKDLKGIEIDPRDLPSELNEMLEQFVEALIEKEEAVPYTHLTLPTTSRV